MAMFEIVAGTYIMPDLAGWQAARLEDDLTRLAALFDHPLWLVLDPFFAPHQQARLGNLLAAANRQRVAIIPVLGLQVPEEKRSAWAVVPSAASAADPARPAAICLRHPDVLAFVTARARAFMETYGDAACLRSLAGTPTLHFAGELNGARAAGPCYCEHCAAMFVAAEDDPAISAPPQDNRDLALWWRWQDFQKQALPTFVVHLAQETRGIVPLWIAR